MAHNSWSMQGYEVKNLPQFQGTIARPVVQWETSIEERNEKAEAAHQCDNVKFETMGFTWNEEMLGFFNPNPNAVLPE